MAKRFAELRRRLALARQALTGADLVPRRELVQDITVRVTDLAPVCVESRGWIERKMTVLELVSIGQTNIHWVGHDGPTSMQAGDKLRLDATSLMPARSLAIIKAVEEMATSNRGSDSRYAADIVLEHADELVASQVADNG